MSKIVNINNHDLEIKKFNDKRVVTFKDIDKLHKRPMGTAKYNFNYNNEHFIEDEDYFEINKKDFTKKNTKYFGFSKFAPKGYLITESGYFKLMKCFKDDISWFVWTSVVRDYKNKFNSIFEMTLSYLENNKKASLNDFNKIKKDKIPSHGGLYAFFDDDEVIYIGKANNLKSRYLNHKNNSDWFSSRYKLKICECKNWHAQELRLIKKYEPQYNSVGLD